MSSTPDPALEPAPALEPEPSPWAELAGSPVRALAGHFPDLPPIVASTGRDFRAEEISQIRTKLITSDTVAVARPSTPKGPRRRHELPRVGETFGEFRVTREVPRRASNRRFELACDRGHKKIAIVFNLRTHPDQKCRDCARERKEDARIVEGSPWLTDRSKLPMKPPMGA